MKRGNFLEALTAGIAAACIPLQGQLNDAAREVSETDYCQWELTQLPWVDSTRGAFKSSNLIACCRTHGYGKMIYSGAISQSHLSLESKLEPSFYVPLTLPYHDIVNNPKSVDTVISEMMEVAHRIMKIRCKDGCYYTQAMIATGFWKIPS